MAGYGTQYGVGQHGEEYASGLGPVVTTYSPTGAGATKDVDIYFELDPPGDIDVDETTINVVVDATPAVISGVFQSGWSGTITSDGAGGFDVTVTKDTDYASEAVVAVDIDARDDTGSTTVLSWTFTVTDYIGVLVIPQTPTIGQTDVAVDSHIVIRMQESAEVVLDSIEVYVDLSSGYQLAYEGGGSPDFKSGWDGPASALTGPITDRLLTIDRVGALPQNTTISVMVIAKDPQGNSPSF